MNEIFLPTLLHIIGGESHRRYYRPRYPSRSILCLCPIFIYLFLYHYLPPFEFPTLSQKLAIASLSNFLGILRTSVRRSDRNCSGI